MAIILKAVLPYVVVVTVGIFRRPLITIVMRSGGKYTPAIKDGRLFVVDIFADEKNIFNFNLIRKFYKF